MIEQGVDTSTSAGRAFFSMLAVFAQFETDVRRERQAEGIARAKRAGVYTGGKPRISRPPGSRSTPSTPSRSDPAPARSPRRRNAILRALPPASGMPFQAEEAHGTQLVFASTVMKLIAHRGWSAGGDENTLVAFARAARDDRISGVEFDVCRSLDSGTLIVSHDPPLHTGNALSVDAALSFLSQTDLELFVEIKETGLAPEVIRLVLANVADRSVVFAFAAIARSFPWEDARPVRLGIIVPYPWSLDHVVRRYAPDVLLLGWDARAWTRIAFRAWWSVFLLERLSQRYHLPAVVGVARRTDDLRWLSRQHVYGAVASMDLTIAASDKAQRSA